ncbi:DnaB-like replicative helicase [Cellulophaga phage phi39:1]|uniref:DnaB-like replicative helicase n=1 Tax=Cellulophaga phage phi39:1 TaxID=1327993 RepID=UPI00035182E2|nr:DnaB-like replicative helicase [Cellulophaga phage phi39:1]AGO49157.1 replicative DNA helicase [Cellulophaga phage phi39:1]
MNNDKKIKSSNYGKIPPQAIDLEKSVLGAMLIDSRAVDEAITIIQSSDTFFNTAHQDIFEAINDLYKSGSGVDLLLVSNQLKRNGKLETAGGDFYLIGLTQKVASGAHVEFHSRILVQNYIKRRVIFMNAQITALCYDENTDVFEMLDKYQNGFDKIVDVTAVGRRSISFSDSLDHLKAEIEILSSNKEEVPLVGCTTGLKRTDKHTGGYRPGDLVVLAARPGMGKTAKVLKTVIENVKKDIPVGFISLEMSSHQLAARSVAIDTDFHLGQLLKTGFHKIQYFERYDEHAKRMKKYPLYVDDSGQSDLNHIVITAKTWARVHGIKLLVVDYLQLMTDKNCKGNREQEISGISRRLKMLAKELQVPIIALCQLSRAVETRGGSKRPLLSDLRESGAIEQDADIVEFIYRPDYYKIEMSVDDYDLDDHKDLIMRGANSEIIFAKYRGGSLGTALVKWVGDKTKFIDVDDVNDQVNYISDGPVKTVDPREAFGPTDDNNNKTVFDG